MRLFLDAMSEWERRVFPKVVNATDVQNEPDTAV